MKIKGGILLYALVVSIICTIISLAILSYFYMSSEVIRQNLENRKIRNSLESGWNIALKSEYSDWRSCSSFSKNFYKVNIFKKHWGLYTLIGSKIEGKNSSFSKVALCGRDFDAATLPALYACDNGDQISIDNYSILNGPLFVPKKGVKYVSMRDGKGSNFRNLDIKLSANILPPVTSDIINYISDLFGEYPYTSVVRISGDLPEFEMVSFSDSTKIYMSEKAITITSRLEGNIIIKSDLRITISPSALLDMVILVAPEIEISSGFVGSIQCFASRKLLVNEDCHLIYPSSLVLYPLTDSNDTCQFTISKRDSVEGNVVLLKPVLSNNLFARLDIKEKSLVRGIVYSQGEVNFAGSVEGSIYGKKFVYSNENSTMSDYISNVTIDSKKIKKFYLFGDLFYGSDLKELSKLK